MADVRIMAKVQEYSRTSKAGTVSSKFGIDIKTTGDPVFRGDDKALAGELGAAILDVIKTQLGMGNGPDGAPLPPISGATEVWREREAAQGARGGDADPKYKDQGFRAKVQARYRRDYTSRIGAFTPAAGGPRGNVSGLLRESMAMRPHRDGKGWSIYVAARRGKPRPGDGPSALESTYAGVNIAAGVEAMLNGPKGKSILATAAKSTLANDLRTLLQNASRTASLLASLNKGED